MVDYKLPQPTEPLVLPDGSISTRWYNYWRTRVENSSVAELLALIQELAAQIEELQGLNPKLTGVDSVSVLGQLLSGATVRLVNDQASPLAANFYSTDDELAKGWNPLYPHWVPNPYADYLVNENGDYLIDENGNFLTGQDGFPIPLEYGGTGGDYSSVAANLAFASPDGSAGYPVFRALVADDIPDHNEVNGLQGGQLNEYFHLTAAEHTEIQALVAGGTTGQFWRGDGAWSNGLLGDLGVGTSTPGLIGNGRELTITSTATDTLGRLNIQGTRSGTTGNIASVTAFNNATPVAQLTAGLDAAADAGQFSITTKPTGGSLAVRMNFLSDGTVNPGADNTQTFGSSSLRWSNTFTYNLTVGQNAPSFGGGDGVQFLGNAATAPTSNPTGGGILYVSGGALFYRGSSGTITPLAPA
jgi:hypothetical protein